MNDAEDRIDSPAGGGAGGPSLWTAPKVERRVAGGCAWGAAALGASAFAMGAVVIVLVLVTGESGAYGLMAILGALLCWFGVALLGLAGGLWTAHRVRARSSPRRTAGALVALAGGVALSLPPIADLLGVATPSTDGNSLPAVAGGTLLVLAAVLAADRSERRPVLLFAALVVLLLGIFVYRTSTDLRVEVVWLGPSVIGPTPGQVGFSATRSGAFEVRFGARFCWDGRLVATGRYQWQPDDPRSKYGATMFVDLPSDILPLQPRDLVRVCVREGLAAGTAAGEVSLPPSFSPLD